MTTDELELAAYKTLTADGWIIDEREGAIRRHVPYDDTCQDTLPGVLTTPHVMRMV